MRIAPLHLALALAVFSAESACIAPVEAQELPGLRFDLPLSEQIQRDFFSRDGLPSDWVNDLVQTRDGYLWVATDNGLARYDGRRFQRFDPTTTPELRFREMRVLREGSDGSLWIGTTSGLTRYQPGRPGKFSEIMPIVGKTVREIYEDSDGSIWVGTEQETYVRPSAGDFTVVARAPQNVRAICEDAQGVLWFGSHFGLFRRQRDGYQQITHELLPAHSSQASAVPQSRVNAIFAEDDGSLWIGTNRALLHMQDSEFTERGREIEAQQFYEFVRSANGALYVAARFGLYRAIGNEPFEQILDRPSAFAVLEDRVGDLWVGHGDNRGLHHYRNNFIESIWNETRVRCAFGDGDGNLWFGSSSGLHRLRDGVITDYGLEAGLPDLRVQTIINSREGSMWIGTGKGMVKWTGTELAAGARPAELADMNIGTALEDSAGTLWLSLSTDGGYRLRDEQLDALPMLAGQRVHWFWEEPGGTIWVGGEAGLFQWNEDKFRKVDVPAIDHLLQPRFLCHFEATDGTLWLGTSNGIIRYRDGKYQAFAPEDGLRADNVERLAADRHGNLWYGGRDGLFHVSVAELDGFVAGQLESVVSFRVDGFDRFPPINAFSQGCVARDDALFLVSELGLVRLPIRPLSKATPLPKVYIEQATIDGKPTAFEQRFEFLSGRRRLSIQFAVPALVDPQHVQVRYRLEPFDDDWVDAGDERVAHYTDLRPGRYQFHVGVRRGNDAWTDSEGSVAFTVVPRWWERTSVRVAAFVVLGLVGLGYIQFRIRSLREANDTLRREMNDRIRAEEASRNHLSQLARVSRVASMGELTTSIAHEIKQPLFAIVSNAQTARRLLDRDAPDVDEVRDALHDIADDGNRASRIIDRVRSLVRKERQVMNEIDLNEVARQACQFAESELGKRGFVIETELASDLPKIEGDVIELQQVILNLLINGAQAMKDTPPERRLLALRTSVSDGSVELSVEDRGVGSSEKSLDKMFEPFFTTKPQGTGMGLAINRTIIEAHNGHIWADRNPEGGLKIRFTLPIPSQAGGNGRDTQAQESTS